MAFFLVLSDKKSSCKIDHILGSLKKSDSYGKQSWKQRIAGLPFWIRIINIYYY